jgi:hypothetical protein
MRITNKIPDTWQELQSMVAQVLQDCGMDVEVEKVIQTVRGSVEIDVYAEETINSRKYSTICECKHWKSNIPQHVIHGMRTVLSDIGCNKGYIITTSYFQSGSISAVDKTNLELLTWDEFQEVFFEDWYEKYFCETLNSDLKLPSEYHLIPWFDDLSREDKRNYSRFRNNLSDINNIMSYFCLPLFEKKYNGINIQIPKLPLRGNLIETDSYEFMEFPNDIIDEVYYQEFLEKFIPYSKKSILDFLELEKKYTSNP